LGQVIVMAKIPHDLERFENAQKVHLLKANCPFMDLVLALTTRIPLLEIMFVSLKSSANLSLVPNTSVNAEKVSGTVSRYVTSAPSPFQYL
jgi:hypothetical protein